MISTIKEMLPADSIQGKTAIQAPFSGGRGAFLSVEEKQAIFSQENKSNLLQQNFLTALEARVYARVANPGLLGLKADVQWWYPAAEYVSDAAMLYALQPEERLGIWLRDVVLAIIRKPVYDWVGPFFRDHTEPFTGHLETAHLCWAVASAYDLASAAFDGEEQEEIRLALQEKGITLCIRWVQKNSHLANWRGIMVSGLVVAAAVIGDEETLNKYVTQLILCAEAFQPDGSYAESLQYGNYLAFALMIAYESLVRRYPDLAAQLNVAAYAKGMPWVASSMLYSKPMSGWGDGPRARAANFNDSAVLFRSSGDLLLHIAVRCKEALPTEAGLARWLFDRYYAPVPTQKPNHLATFGFHNDWGFLTLPLLLQATQAISPEEAQLPLTQAFSNGHTFIRDGWDGKTIIALQGGGDALYGPGHLHGDLSSFILVHNKERFLIDPGHSCYRNLIHGLESSTQTHNTCTFLIEQDNLGLQEDLAKAKLLEQHSVLARRKITEGKAGTPIDRGNRQLIIARKGEVSVVGAEVSKTHEEPVEEFSRFWIAAGSHVLFVIDRIRTSQPVTTTWNWLLNNRDGESQILPQARQITMRRGKAGLKIFHTSNGKLSGPVYSYAHDAYHPEPNQPGEGKPGSGLLYRWTEPQSNKFRTVVHAFAFDEYGFINQWQLEANENKYTLTKGQESWQLQLSNTQPMQATLSALHQDKRWQLAEKKQVFSFE